jgi:hypothetical protein
LLRREHTANLGPFAFGDRLHLDARVGVLSTRIRAVGLAQLLELIRVLLVDRLDLALLG